MISYASVKLKIQAKLGTLKARAARAFFVKNF